MLLKDMYFTNYKSKMDFNLLDYQTRMEEGYKILLYYKGPFDELILTKIGNYLRTKFSQTPKAGSKIFAIFIEMAQNISYYSAETDLFDDSVKTYGIGTIVVNELHDCYKLISGNMVTHDIASQLIEKCREINQLDSEGLRIMKKEIRSAPRRELHKGGNIGLIQMAIKSENHLEIETKAFDDVHAFVTISTTIDKKDLEN
jgi:hypothetical protein